MILKDLHIENFSLIENLSLNFDSGINCVNGESGSGKSLIFKSLRILFGDNSPVSYIRPKTEECILILTLWINVTEQEILKSLHPSAYIEYEIQLKKIIKKKGKSKLLLNDVSISQKDARFIFENFCNSFSQGDQFKLYNPSYQLDMIDSYGNEEISTVKSKLSDVHSKIKSIHSDLKIKEDEKNKNEKSLEYNKYCLEEIGSKLKIKNLKEEKDLIEFISDSKSYEKRSSKINELKQTIGYLDTIKNLLEYLSESNKEIDDNLNFVKNIANQLITESNNKFTQEDLLSKSEDYSNYLYLLNKYKCKNLEELLIIKDKFTNEINQNNILSKEIEKLKEILEDYKNNYLTVSTELSNLRKKYTEKFIQELKQEIYSLDFEYFYFESVFTELKKISSNGTDALTFYISFNSGIDPFPLEKVISGGEASRLSLCILKILKSKDKVFFLDEIDTGLDSRSLSSIAKKLKEIKDLKNQILCISHNEEIINISDKSFKIEKNQNFDIAKSCLVI